MSTNTFAHAIIFDFDGVLANTYPVALQILANIAKRKNVVAPTADFCRNHATQAILKQLNIRWWELPYIAYISRKQARQLNPTVELFPWAKNLLEIAIAHGGQTWIVSSNSDKRIRETLQLYNLNNHVSIIGNISFFGKARYLRKVIKKLNLQPSAVLYVGDETRDVEAAQQAGVKFMGVSWGFQSAELLSSLNYGSVLEDPNDFAAKVAEILLN